MALEFPNLCRSFDITRNAVRFWGYQGAIEWSFFVTVDALRRIETNLRSDEAGILDAFDKNRKRILVVASTVFAQGRKGSYELSAADF